MDLESKHWQIPMVADSRGGVTSATPRGKLFPTFQRALGGIAMPDAKQEKRVPNLRKVFRRLRKVNLKMDRREWSSFEDPQQQIKMSLWFRRFGPNVESRKPQRYRHLYRRGKLVDAISRQPPESSPSRRIEKMRERMKEAEKVPELRTDEEDFVPRELCVLAVRGAELR